MKLLILYTAIFFMVAECSFAIHLSVPNKPSKKTFCLIFESGITGTLQYKDEVFNEIKLFNTKYLSITPLLHVSSLFLNPERQLWTKMLVLVERNFSA